MTEQKACTLCGAGGHSAAQCSWNKASAKIAVNTLRAGLRTLADYIGPKCRNAVEVAMATTCLDDTAQPSEQAEGAQGEREAFEHYMKNVGWAPSLKRFKEDPEEYDVQSVQRAWHQWQAQTRATLARVAELENQEPVAEVVKREPYEDGTPNPCNTIFWTGQNSENDFPDGTKLYAAPVAQAGQAKKWTYASEQETNCAGCGKRKHTPLRVDWMGGYVCLTCILDQLEALHDAAQAGQVPECFRLLLKHAHGMTTGVDWNKGTAAGHHREPLGEAVVQCQAWLAAAPQPERSADNE